MVSFLICSHKAPPSLDDTLFSLSRQTRAVPFEVLLINNGFAATEEHRLVNLAATLGLAEHFQIHREPIPGLGFARKCGFERAHGEWLVMLDDDNTVDPDFLSNLRRSCAEHPNLGGITPCVAPVWERTPPEWLVEFGASCLSYNLTDTFRLRPLEKFYPASDAHQSLRPPGGGMIIHRKVAEYYLSTADQPARLALERTGDSLVGCQDDDIWRGIKPLRLDVLVTDRLQVRHHIPAARLRKKYLLRLNFQMAFSYAVLGRLLGETPAVRTATLLRETLWMLVRVIRDFVFHGRTHPFWQQALFVARELGRAKGQVAKLAAPDSIPPGSNKVKASVAV